MKRWLAFLSLLNMVTAQAQELVQVDTLRILGRGVSDRRTHESIVLACEQMVENECKSIRFVHIDKDGKAYFVGTSMPMPDASSVRLEKKAIQVEVREYFAEHETDQSLARKGTYAQNVALLIAGLTVFVSFGGIVLSPIAAAVIVIGGGSTLAGILTSDHIMNSLASGVVMDARSVDQKGWNWSQDPKRISHAKFDAILSQLTSKDSWKNWDSLHKVHRKKWRLQYRHDVKFE